MPAAGASVDITMTTSKPGTIRWILFAAIPIFYLLHNDFWWWDDPSSFLGLPIGLSYHFLFCLAVAGLMRLMVVYAWPRGLEDEGEEDDS